MSDEPLAAIPGVRAIESLLRHTPRRIKSVEITAQRRASLGILVHALESTGVPIRIRSEAELERCLGGVRHQGIVARVEPAGYADWESLLARPDALVVAFDQVTDQGNFGAILRSAEALGATGALVTRRRCANLGPAAARTSAGASELLPVARVPNLALALRAARGAAVQVIGADAEGSDPSDIDWDCPTVVVLGAEGHGLRRLTRTYCDRLVGIPMRGVIESLNVSSAAAILLYAAARGRSGLCSGQ